MEESFVDQLLIMAKPEHIKALATQLKDDLFLEKINQPKDFIDSLELLIENPYICKSCGETFDTIFEIRREFVKVYCDQLLNKEAIEVKFGAWLLFKQKNVVYVTIQEIYKTFWNI
jgi:hypothetical protein